MLALWRVSLLFLSLFFFTCTDIVFVGHFFEVEAQFFSFFFSIFANVFCSTCVVDHCTALYGNARHSRLRSEAVVEGNSLSSCGVCYLARESLAAL